MSSESDVEMVPLTPSQDLLTAGQMLKQAREATGMHVAALAVAMKVPVRKLEALESGELESTMDPVFVRAIASSVCRHLHVPAEAILAKLPQVATPKLSSTEGAINAPFHRDTDPQFTGWKDFLSHKTVVLVFGILVLASLLYGAPYIEEVVVRYAPLVDGLMSHSQSAPAPVAEAVQTPAPSESSLGKEVVNEPAVALSASVAAESQTPAALASSPESKELIKPVSMDGANPSTTPSTQNAVAFRATEESWVEVTDASGKVLLRKLLAPSEMVGASGQFPLSIVVGKAAVTEVWVHGKPYDLAPIARENVARFEVKF
ncbi:helix-turn-helix domain-containing protein [Curvibacter sp. CHRR-16]|uniref:helix-turn-helix domain-containing protein n=1 Tax=Curvibacter sp. CHRR-16 TaxID=2835872 RepID=UPI001BDAE0A2|nr:helix-turn-helix domain-containing protein [Curvibacter sp. CHRR-16]MBT0570636.1 helix-turn-helix domain-containing protein [Curvibacter sp. CHRR-16]